MRKINLSFNILLAISLVGLTILLFSTNFLDLIEGFISILLHPSLLVTDYLAVGGLHATLLNAWILTSIAILILSKLKVQFNGIAFAGVLTIFGFSFFGKNVLNVAPIWLGFYLFTLYKKTPLKNYTGTFLFASGLAPLSSFIAFGIPNLELWYSIPLGIVAGMLGGFIAPMIVAIVGKFHQGYNLYNTGFGLGFIALLFNALLKSLQVDVSVTTTVSFDHHVFLSIFILIFSILSLMLAFYLNRKPWFPYLRLLASTGSLPSDYAKEYGVSAMLVNTGFLGLYALLIVLIYRFQISGPMFAGIFTMIGFGGYGKHLRNVIPVMTGLTFATLLPSFNIQDLGPSIALFFVTAVAPVAGKYGIFYGLLAGFIHLILTPHTLALQGGFDLYNNGFTAGFVAGIVVAIAQQVTIKLKMPSFKKKLRS
jgi:hypothetical protein